MSKTGLSSRCCMPKPLSRTKNSRPWRHPQAAAGSSREAGPHRGHLNQIASSDRGRAQRDCMQKIFHDLAYLTAVILAVQKRKRSSSSSSSSSSSCRGLSVFWSEFQSGLDCAGKVPRFRISTSIGDSWVFRPWPIRAALITYTIGQAETVHSKQRMRFYDDPNNDYQLSYT